MTAQSLADALLCSPTRAPNPFRTMSTPGRKRGNAHAFDNDDSSPSSGSSLDTPANSPAAGSWPVAFGSPTYVVSPPATAGPSPTMGDDAIDASIGPSVFGAPTTPKTVDARPGLKRRKTAPMTLESAATAQSPGNYVSPSPTSSTSSADSPIRQLGSPLKKSGADIWPPKVEDAFWEALRTVPKLGRRKVLVNDKPCGRNELIAIYIQYKTGVSRSRKQVSSHIQVLKNHYRGNVEFENLVSEPREGEENFSGLSPEIFGVVTLCGPTSGSPLRAPSPPSPEALASPQHLAPSRPLAYRSLSVGNSPLASPAVSERAFSDYCPSPAASTALQATASLSGLTSGLRSLQLPMTRAAPRMMPFALDVVGVNPLTGFRHSFMSIAEAPRQPDALAHVVDLGDQSRAGVLFGRLEAMASELACPMVHVGLNLSLPAAERNQHCSQIGAVFRIGTLTNAPLTCVTTVYSVGDQLLQMIDPLAPPQAVPDAGAPEGFVYVYVTPFAEDFWRNFLRGAPELDAQGRALPTPQSYARTPAGRAALGAAAQRVVVVQEFVVRTNNTDHETALAGAPANFYSTGALLGDVKLVVVYEAVSADDEARHGRLSRLEPLSGPYADAHVRAATPVVRASPRSSVSSTTSSVAVAHELMPPPPPAVFTLETEPRNNGLGRRRGAHKAGGLSLTIPPPLLLAPTTTRSGQVTPLPQMVHTPSAPPPLEIAPSSAARERLQRHWASLAQPNDLASPALFGAFPPVTGGTPVSAAAALAPALHVNDHVAQAEGSLGALTASAMAVGTPCFPSFDPSTLALPASIVSHHSAAERALAAPEHAAELGSLAYGTYATTTSPELGYHASPGLFGADGFYADYLLPSLSSPRPDESYFGLVNL